MKSNDHIITTPDDLKLLRIDFAATIVKDDGTKEIATIELQKAFEEEEVMRFRKYMGLQISSENNTVKVVKTKRNKDFSYRKVKNKPPESLENNGSRAAVLIVKMLAQGYNQVKASALLVPVLLRVSRRWSSPVR